MNYIVQVLCNLLSPLNKMRFIHGTDSLVWRSSSSVLHVYGIALREVSQFNILNVSPLFY